MMPMRKSTSASVSPASDRDISRLDDLRVNTPNGAVPISNFVTREAHQRIDSINRRDGKRVLMVRANAEEGYAGNILVAELRAWIEEQIEAGRIDRSVDIDYLGADEENAEAGAFFAGAMLASLFMMAVILLWQFNNFWHVVLTLQAVVLSVVGVLLGVLLTFPYISILFLGTGVVTLAGIVVNNNIVLIDTFQRLRGLGMAVDEAIVRTAAQRLRPVMLTTITTIFGLLPMVFQINADFAHGVLSIRRTGLGMVGAIVLRRGLGAGLLHPAHPDPDPGPAGHAPSAGQLAPPRVRPRP